MGVAQVETAEWWQHDCVVAEAEGRRRIKRRIFHFRSMSVRQECRRRGLARHARQRIHVRINEMVEAAMLGRGKWTTRCYSLVESPA